MSADAEIVRQRWSRIRWPRLVSCLTRLLAVAVGLPVLLLAIAAVAACVLPRLGSVDRNAWDRWCGEHRASYRVESRGTWFGRLLGKHDLPDDLPGVVYGTDVVTGLTLTGAGDDTIDYVVRRAPGLEEIELKEPALTANGYRTLATAPRLSRLRIAAQTLPAAAFEPFRRHPLFGELSVTGCALRGLDLTPLGEAPALKYVTFSACDFDGADLAWLKPDSAVSTLALRDCQIGGGHLRSLAGATRLSMLAIVRTPRDGEKTAELSDDSLRVLAGFTQLLSLQLEGLPLTDRALAALPSLPSLRYLSLQSRLLTDAGIAGLPAFPQLEELLIDGPSVGDEGLAAIARSPRLRNLRLDGSLLSDNGLAGAAGLSELMSVTLENTRFSGAGLRHVVSLPRLGQLHLPGSHLTAEGLAGLQGLALAGLSLERSTLDAGAIAQLAHLEARDDATSKVPFFMPAGREGQPRFHLGELSLAGTSLDVAAMAALSRVAVQENLRLDQCGLTGDALAAYVPVVWPERLVLDGNPASPEAIEALRQRQKDAAQRPDATLDGDSLFE